MARTNHRAITGEAHLLFGVPKNAIVDTLLEADAELLSRAFEAVTATVEQVGESSLIALSHSDLIRVFQAAEISSGEIRRLHNEFRYRGMKSLYLYTCEYSTNGVTIDVTALNNILVGLHSDYQRRSAHSSFSQVQFSDIDELEVSTRPPIELPYSYVATVQIVDPQTKYPTLVNDLRRGFVWLQVDEAWLAVCAHDEAINGILVKALEQHLNCTAKRLYFPKSVLQQVESLENIRRATSVDKSTGTRRRWTNANMAADNQAMSEFRVRDEQDERPSSGYTLRWTPLSRHEIA